MRDTHIEYDDFGEYTETVDLVLVGVPQKAGLALRVIAS